MTSRGSVAPDATHRLFLALDLPAPSRRALCAWADACLSGGGRRVPEEALHVTLAFLGERRPEEVAGALDALRDAVGSARVGPLTIAGWRESDRVGMVVLDDPSDGATRLHAALRSCLRARGVEPAGPERWLPHVTIVRRRATTGAVVSPPTGRTLVPSDAAAYLSRPGPTGARYTPLLRLPLHPLTEEEEE